MPTRRMSVREARANFGDLLGSVHYTQQPVVIEKKGKPIAVVISIEEFQRLNQPGEEFFAVIDRIRSRNEDKDPDEVLRDVTTEVEAVRQERYDERQARLAGEGKNV